jgi:hypothetical protein
MILSFVKDGHVRGKKFARRGWKTANYQSVLIRNRLCLDVDAHLTRGQKEVYFFKSTTALCLM